MEEGKKHIDDLFRDELGGYTETPPSQVWESLEQRLDDGNNHVTGGMFPYRLLWFVLALLLLLLLTTFGFYVAKRIINSEKKQTTQQIHNNLKNHITANEEKQTTINKSPIDSVGKPIDKIHFANGNKDGKLIMNSSAKNSEAVQKHINKGHRHRSSASAAFSKNARRNHKVAGAHKLPNNSGKSNIDSTGNNPSATYASNTKLHKQHRSLHIKAGQYASQTSLMASANSNSTDSSNNGIQTTDKQSNRKNKSTASSLKRKSNKHNKYSHAKASVSSLPIANDSNPNLKNNSNNDIQVADKQLNKSGNINAASTKGILHKKTADLYAAKTHNNPIPSSTINQKTGLSNDAQTTDKELNKAKIDSRLTVKHSKPTRAAKTSNNSHPSVTARDNTNISPSSNNISQPIDTEYNKGNSNKFTHISTHSKTAHKHKKYIASDIAYSGKPINVAGDNGNSDSLKAEKSALAKRKSLKVVAAKFGKEKEMSPNSAIAKPKKLNNKAAALGKKRSLRISPDSSDNTKYYSPSNTTKSNKSKNSSQSQGAKKIAKTTKPSGARHKATNNNTTSGNVNIPPPTPAITTPTSLPNNNTGTVAQTTPSKSPQQLAEEKRERNLDMNNYQNAALNNQSTDTTTTPAPNQNQTNNGGGGGGGGNPDNALPVAHKRTSSKLEGGLKAGYELGMASYKPTADKYVISPYLQYNVNDKFALLFQPGIKFDQYKNLPTYSSQSFYNILGYPKPGPSDSFSIVKRDSHFPDSFSRTRYYVYKENSNTITVSFSAQPKTNWEIELPILLKYQVTHGIYIYGGVNLLFSNAMQISPSITNGSNILKSDTISFAPVDVFDTSSIPAFSTRPDTFFTHKGQPYSSYTNPYPTSTANALQMGYIVGLNFVIKDRLLLDVMVQQSISPNNGILSNFRSIYTQPYIRFTIGYKLFGK